MDIRVNLPTNFFAIVQPPFHSLLLALGEPFALPFMESGNSTPKSVLGHLLPLNTWLFNGSSPESVLVIPSVTLGMKTRFWVS